jgi:hypothetical protein
LSCFTLSSSPLFGLADGDWSLVFVLLFTFVFVFVFVLLFVVPFVDEPPVAPLPDVVPVIEPLLVPEVEPLVFVLLLTFVFVLTLLFTFESALLEPVLGEALGLEVVVPCVESVLCVPEPTFVDEDWLVDVVWSPEPTLLDEFWLPEPMFVLGLTLVFGLIVTEPLGVLPETLGVVDVPVCAVAGPKPATIAASEAAAMVAYRCFIRDPPRV